MNHLRFLCGVKLPPLNYTLRRHLNNNIASVTKVHREVYTRLYPTIVVLPDGSSINIRYHEPRRIIKVIFVEVYLASLNAYCVYSLLVRKVLAKRMFFNYWLGNTVELSFASSLYY